MAKLRKAVLGNVSGALGAIVFKEREGLNYMATRPNSFMPGTNPAAVSRRGRFAMAGKSSSFIYRIGELRALWNAVKLARETAYNHIFKTNYRYVSASDITNLLQLTPDNGFGVTVANNNVDRTRVRAMIKAIGTNAGINTNLEKNIMMASLVFLSSPVDESVGAYSLLNVVSPSQPINLSQDLTFDANLTNQQSLIFDKYHITKTFIALVTLDTDSSPVHYSSTVLLA